MQVTIYLNEEDKYLLDLVDQEALRTRRSRSAVIMSILESHFMRGKKLGEILVAMQALSPQDLESVLAEQGKKASGKLLGEILVEKGLVASEVVHKALLVQERLGHKGRSPAPTSRPKPQAPRRKG